MLRSLLWMVRVRRVVFLVRLKNSDTVNLRWVFQRTYGRRSLRGGSSLRTAVGIYTVFYNSMEILWAVVLIYMYNQSFISL
jgi:hypothetical protein